MADSNTAESEPQRGNNYRSVQQDKARVKPQRGNTTVRNPRGATIQSLRLGANNIQWQVSTDLCA